MTESRGLPRLLATLTAVFAVFAVSARASAQTPAAPVITGPAAGQVLQGQVQVIGTTDIPGFSTSELDFAYDPNPTGVWFTIQTASLPVGNGLISAWDTTSISDGDYLLRLRVTLFDGSSQQTIVGVRVRNYTAVPSPTVVVTPTATVDLEIPTPMLITASETPAEPLKPAAPTPTAIAPNPAGITTQQVSTGFWKGALVVGLLVLAFGVLLRLRR